MENKLKETAVAYAVPPKIVQNERGEIVEVILSYADYKLFLHFLADHVDWELLPSYLQDAVDHLLAEEARLEQGDSPPTPLAEVLAELGIKLDENTAHS